MHSLSGSRPQLFDDDLNTYHQSRMSLVFIWSCRNLDIVPLIAEGPAKVMVLFFFRYNLSRVFDQQKQRQPKDLQFLIVVHTVQGMFHKYVFGSLILHTRASENCNCSKNMNLKMISINNKEQPEILSCTQLFVQDWLLRYLTVV